MTFDVERARAGIDEFLRFPDLSFDEVREKGSLCGYGWTYLHYAEEGFIVGKIETGMHLLRQAKVYLEASLEFGQKPYLDSERIRSTSLAMCHWLAEGQQDWERLRLAAKFEEAEFSQSHPTIADLGLAGCYYLDAEEFETWIRRCELSGMKPAAKLRRTLGEAAICYAIARHRLGLAYTAEEIAAALHAFLERQVPEWLDDGHYPRVVLWMKIAFWKPGDDPIATILRCYDYLPGVERPKYP